MTRSSVLVVGALLLATTTLSSCGFDNPTDRDYTPAVGPDDRSSVVNVLSAVIVAARPGSGTFVASLSNASTTDPHSFDTLTGPDADQKLQAVKFAPVQVPAGGLVNLADGKGVEVTGDFTAGSFVEVAVGFDNGETSQLDIPVVTACDEYAGLDLSGSSDSPTAAGTELPSAGTTPEPATTAASPTTQVSVTTLSPTSAVASAYACDPAAEDSSTDLESSDAATAEAGQ